MILNMMASGMHRSRLQTRMQKNRKKGGHFGELGCQAVQTHHFRQREVCRNNTPFEGNHLP